MAPGKCPKVPTVISDNVDVFTVKTDECPESLIVRHNSSFSKIVVMEDLTAHLGSHKGSGGMWGICQGQH